MMPKLKTHPLHRWFETLVQDSFQQEVGLGDPHLLDYLADLLTEFIHIEHINHVDDNSGRSVTEIAEMLTEAELASSGGNRDRRRLYHRHIGDYTLFWTGIYPENLRFMRHHGARDELLDFYSQGKRSYAIASELSSDVTVPAAGVLRALSEQFEYCVYGLGLVRRKWEKNPGNGVITLLPPA